MECIEAVKTGKYDSAFVVSKIQDFLWMNGKPLNFDPANVPRSQDLDSIYRETSGLYVFTRESYMYGHARMGKHPYMKEVSFKEAVDINNPEDFELAACLLKM
jgi:CMP-N-acetylneuraminic acid synthetase